MALVVRIDWPEPGIDHQSVGGVRNGVGCGVLNCRLAASVGLKPRSGGAPPSSFSHGFLIVLALPEESKDNTQVLALPHSV